jgi:hypothetical protein
VTDRPLEPGHAHEAGVAQPASTSEKSGGLQLLVTSAAKTLTRLEHPNLRRLVTPRHYGAEHAWRGYWAADNDCFQGLDRRTYLKMLAHLAAVDTSRLLFVTAPDVVGDSEATLTLFDAWEPMLHDCGFPVALVGQDGLSAGSTPWDRLDAFFVGGTTEWKMGLPAARLVQEAKRRGKHVHMGRVNSVQRIRYAQAIGCDSIDGTQFSMFANTYIPGALAWIGVPQGGLVL